MKQRRIIAITVHGAIQNISLLISQCWIKEQLDSIKIFSSLSAPILPSLILVVTNIRWKSYRPTVRCTQLDLLDLLDLLLTID